MNSLRQDSSGFTIVELLIGIAVSAFFIGGVATMLGNNAKLSHRARDVAAANSYVENKIESLRSTGFLGLNDGTTDLTSELPSELKSPRSGTLVITSQTGAIKRAVVSISYNDQGASRTYSYTTYVGELGVGQY